MEEKVAPSAVARGLISCNPRYLVSPAGILKLVEVVVLMLAWAICSGFRNGYVNFTVSTGVSLSDINYSSSGIGFFLFVTVTLWIIVIGFIVLGLLGLIEKLRIPMKMLLFAIFHAVSAVLLLIATAVIAADAAAIPTVWCDAVRKSNLFSTTCATYEAAVAFGAFSIIAFIVDAVLYFFNYRTDAGGGAATV